MKLIDLLTTGKQIKTLPKSEIPNLLGEIEMLKAQLWVRLIEPEEMDSVSIAKTVRNPTNAVENPVKPISHGQSPRPEGRILRIKEVVRMVGLSKSTIWKMHKEGKFPKLKNIGPRSVGWLDSDIHGWD